MQAREQQTLLIVDDTPTNLKVLSKALKDAGYKVAVAVDGESAIEQVEHRPPDLILLDILMPGIDGFETCRRFKSNPETREIPVIFMTALAESEDKVKGINTGAVDYITKPFQKEEVLVRVKTHLQIRHLMKTVTEQNRQLQQNNTELEGRVEERTATLKKALNDLQNMQLQLIQQEKLSALGQLVAGVAHEINNPVNFISHSIAPAKASLDDLIRILRLYQEYYPDPVAEIQEESEDVDLEFTLEDLPKIFDSLELGADRILKIAVSLRNFARADTSVKMPTDIHEGLDNTLLILGHRLKSVGDRPEIAVIKHYGDIPDIHCYPGQLNQVFMNIFANAIDALEEKMAKQGKSFTSPQIRIATKVSDGDCVTILIADNALGMSEEIRHKLFEPLFTTKPANKGTGLGLSISRQIVADKHQGELNCHSAIGEGTEFAIVLPV
ncbi:MAG: response regulator [Cyanobacteria bacterium SBLK]|nr:response regulator [Cyanobacteria bacterium SBLK]